MHELFAGTLCLPQSPVLEDAVQRLLWHVPGDADLNLGPLCRLKAVLYDAMALHLESLPQEKHEQSERLTAARARPPGVTSHRGKSE